MSLREKFRDVLADGVGEILAGIGKCWLALGIGAVVIGILQGGLPLVLTGNFLTILLLIPVAMILGLLGLLAVGFVGMGIGKFLEWLWNLRRSK